MDEYIDREAFKKSVEERYCKPCKAEKKDYNGCLCRACWVDDMIDEVECFQTADVAKVVHGRWIPISDGSWAECSECGECCDVSDNGGMAAFELFCDFYKHCPKCGAQMHEGDFCSHGECREGKDEK